VGKLTEGSRDNANVTLEKTNAAPDALLGKRMPCQLCGAGLDIRLSKNGKPYVTCSDCQTQLFIRGKTGIKRLEDLLNSNVLIVGGGNAKGDSPAALFNRLVQLRTQKRDLEEKQGLIFQDPDLTNAIHGVDNEIKRVQGELAKLNGKRGSEKRK
jgi:hypothetical protein